MVIPIYDNDPLDRNPYAFVTWTLMALNVIVFLIQISVSEDTALVITRDFALIPAAVTGQVTLDGTFPPAVSFVTYMFLHASWLHIISNMLFLWVFGDNIEDAMGSVRFLFFYLLCGVAGGVAHVLSVPDSVVPLVGASGAVAGVVAAYLMLRPCASITVLLFGLIPLRLGSAWVLGFWVLTQVWHLFDPNTGDTAWWAHIGGLVVGALLTVVLRRPELPLFECIRPGDPIILTTDSTIRRRRWGSR